ncbi:MAG: cytochrome c oxidase subunit II [Oleiphilaceae bacterium]|nr:cytochrome c oxidase subunit II [Oleiphilaceae bacterium]
MFAFALVVAAAVIALWLYALYRDPGSANDKENRKIHRRWIVGGGLVLPLSAISVLLFFGIPIGHKMLPLPLADEEAVRIEVIGHQWWWEVNYPDTNISLRDTLHMPAGVPVDLHVTSADVIHSFWVPRLGGKIDMIPGHTNVLRLRADKPGTYRGLCAEFCGLVHAGMVFTVEAHDREGFEKWLQEAQDDD